jgi:glycosyltransferase involved in cell wall biosynthesis
LISDAFPPQLGGRSEKVATRAKYLARYGWKVMVLAPALPAASDDAGSDTAPPPPSGVEVCRTPYLFKRRWPSLKHNKDRKIEASLGGRSTRLLDLVALPRGYIRWLPFAITKGVRLARQADVVLSMNNPVTLHIIGWIVSRWARKPWVVEFRDPLVGYAYSKRGPEWINRRLESLIVRTADRVLQIQDFVPDPISARYGDLDPNRFVVIPSVGYDPDDFGHVTPGAAETQGLQIAYTGSFYGETITPVPFLNGLKEFISQSAIPPASLRALFAGDWETRYDDLIRELQLEPYVQHLGYLSRQDCLALWQESQALLLLLGKEEDNLARIPSKFWDYLGARRSMLALVHPEGRAARVVREERLGFVADAEDTQAIAGALEEVWQAYRAGRLRPAPTAAFLAQATRAHSEKMVAATMDELVR